MIEHVVMSLVSFLILILSVLLYSIYYFPVSVWLDWSEKSGFGFHSFFSIFLFSISWFLLLFFLLISYADFEFSLCFLRWKWKSILWYIASLIQVWTAITCFLGTVAAATCQKYWHSVFSFSFSNKYILISPLTSLPDWLFESVNFKIFGRSSRHFSCDWYLIQFPCQRTYFP